MSKKVRVAVNGYGVIGKRIADAVALQDDMELVGISDIVSDWRIKVTAGKGYPVYASSAQAAEQMRAAGIPHRRDPRPDWNRGGWFEVH